MEKTVILGSGVSGLSAGYHLKQGGVDSVIYEKDADWGGLCANFIIDGFRFDRFVHLSFPEDPYIKEHFAKSTDMHDHVPFPSNYYHGTWLRHPAQNNLHPLPDNEKIKIIKDFVDRPQTPVEEIKNYEEWLRCQYGNYFAEHFPFAYTRKYWGLDPIKLETKWVGIRMTTPDLEEVLKGAFSTQEECLYYAKIMRYPKQGGYRSILDTTREGQNIIFNKKVSSIDTATQKVTFDDGSHDTYGKLISSLPLPEIIKMLKNVPQNVLNAAKNLKHTSGYHISLGFNRPDVAKHLWFYIYDEDIPPARIYSPSLKSSDNAPAGCSSLQAEIFYDNDTPIPDKNTVLEITMNKLLEMGLFKPEDVVVKEIRFEKYANITFDHQIYTNREIVINYLTEHKITSIGRFGKWEYFWSHQAFEDGMKAAQNG